jgi:hypothetical protein
MYFVYCGGKMKTDKEGLVYEDNGDLACGSKQQSLERVILESSFRELGEGRVGFTEEEAEYFETIVREQIREFERKKGSKKRKKVAKVLEEIENGDRSEDTVDSTPGED